MSITTKVLTALMAGSVALAAAACGSTTRSAAPVTPMAPVAAVKPAPAHALTQGATTKAPVTTVPVATTEAPPTTSRIIPQQTTTTASTVPPATAPPVTTPPDPHAAYDNAKSSWIQGSTANAAVAGAYWLDAQSDLQAAGETGDTTNYAAQIALLGNLAALPDAMDTPAQAAEQQADVTALNAFFATPGLYR